MYSLSKQTKTLSTRKKTMIAYLKSGLRRTLCLSLLTFISVYSMAQDTDDYSPDAPGATTGVDIMKPGKIDWETGIVLEWD